MNVSIESSIEAMLNQQYVVTSGNLCNDSLARIAAQP